LARANIPLDRKYHNVINHSSNSLKLTPKPYGKIGARTKEFPKGANMRPPWEFLFLWRL
jgi:hypothetical protein